MAQKPRIRRCHHPPLPFIQIRIQKSMLSTQSGIVGHDAIIYSSGQNVQLILARLLSGTGVGVKLRTRSRAAALAYGDAAQVPVDAGQGTLSEPTGELVGTGVHQTIELGVGPAGPECAADVAGAGGRGNRSGRAGRVGRPPATCYTRTTTGRT